MTLEGKGFYIWQIRRCEGGDANAIADEAELAGLTHCLIKIADGTNPYNIDSNTGSDLVPPVSSALTSRGIQVWGWHYVYGYDPLGEADIAIQRIQTLGLDGYAVDVEAPYKQPGRDEAARQFLGRLRASLPTFPMALSSYRYPTYHPQIPWVEFLEKVDINMPQVYWVESHNPGEQLIRSLREFEALTPFRPIIPTGSAYIQGDWSPTLNDINEFLQTAIDLNMSAANFWEWGHTRIYAPELWDAVAAFVWPSEPPQPDILDLYMDALNASDVDQLVALYHDNAVHVTADRTLQGLQAIRGWYENFFSDILPGATFTKIDSSSAAGSRTLSWTASSSAGEVNNGNDSFGLVAGKIIYHYTFFTVV